MSAAPPSQWQPAGTDTNQRKAHTWGPTNGCDALVRASQYASTAQIACCQNRSEHALMGPHESAPLSIAPGACRVLQSQPDQSGTKLSSFPTGTHSSITPLACGSTTLYKHQGEWLEIKPSTTDEWTGLVGHRVTPLQFGPTLTEQVAPEERRRLIRGRERLGQRRGRLRRAGIYRKGQSGW